MNLRWLTFDYVDPELRLTRPQRRAVRQRARHLVRPTSRAVIACLLIVAPLMAFYIWGVVHYSDRFVNAVWPQGGLLQLIGRLLVVYLAIWVVVAWLGRWMYRPFVLRALRELGHDVCPRCGYWLRSLRETSDRCPECGAAREPMPAGSSHERY